MLRALLTIGLLIGSNTFMTFAWYYHLQKKEAWPLWLAIGASWLIALPEYILQVPANRLGNAPEGPFTLGQLKIIQEAITLTIFFLFAALVAKEKLRPNELAGMGIVMVGVVVAMVGRK
jgi:uncharacterized protein (DUF486 family)